MKILKEWYGKSGLLARLYICDGRYFLDYDGCRETSEIYVQGGIIRVQMPDVPKKYINEIPKYIRRG